MKKGDAVAVIGSGISGLLFVKLAKALGACCVYATDIDEYRLKMAKRYGADIVIHAKENVPEQIMEHNEGYLADVVVIATGAVSAVQQGLRSVAPGGTILFFAPTNPGVDVPFPLFELWNKQVRMVSTYAGAPQDITEAMKLIASKKVLVTDMITHRLPLKETAKGFQLVAQAKDSVKVVIEPQI
jgi:L-iditol 2-dehydrogenase